MFSSPSEYRQRRGGAAYTEDSDRLPHGFVRCGYDADTQQYYFRDATTGSTWEGSPGAYYGRMTRVPVVEHVAATASPATSASERRTRGSGKVAGEEDSADFGEEGKGSKVWDRLGRLKEWYDDGSRDYLNSISRRFSTISSRVSTWDSILLMYCMEDKEARLSMIAAGTRRTIFDAM